MQQSTDEAFILYLGFVYILGMTGLILLFYKRRPRLRIVGPCLVGLTALLVSEYHAFLNALFDSGIFIHPTPAQ